MVPRTAAARWDAILETLRLPMKSAEIDLNSTVKHPVHPGGLVALVVAAVGVVFGDIGTSPLYTVKEMFNPQYGLSVDAPTIKGLLSLGFWALMLVVSVKYVIVILRADNDGEGGIMALTALAQRGLTATSRWGYAAGILGIFGAALFLGDSMITPPITVLGAVEGLQIVAPALAPWVLPLSIVILAGLFAFQRFGTARVGRVFGPVMGTWFLAIGAIGLAGIIEEPSILSAINPIWAFDFFARHGWHATLVLGTVVLIVTGGEALYADLGHFGTRPIRWGWFCFVLPALLLNYFGQGALLLRDPSAIANPFYLLVPSWGQIPMIVLATAAAAVASQAVITGAFSVAAQAINLGYLPRLRTHYTSDVSMGQVYLPAINRLLFVSTVALAIGFGSSSALATAYGLSVTGTMLMDTLLLAVVAYTTWHRARLWILPLCFAFVVIDLAFLFANGAKLFNGGAAWVTLAIGIAGFTLMRTWRRGRALLQAELARHGLPLSSFAAALEQNPPQRVSGTAIFLTSNVDIAPRPLVENLKRNKILHRHNLIVLVNSVAIPYVASTSRLSVQPISEALQVITLRFGFMEVPNVPAALRTLCGDTMLDLDLDEATYFTSRETVFASRDRGMPWWRDKIFAFMHRNAAPVSSYFRIPSNQIMEVGAPIKI